MSHKLFFFGATGNIGNVIVQGFAARSEFSVTAAIRPDSRERNAEKIALLEEQGISLVDINDYNNVEEVTAALTGFQTVVSTLSGDGLSAQLNIIEAAKNAGVQLFVPSEFGINYGQFKHEFFAQKHQARDLLEASEGIDHLYFVSGVFNSYILLLLGVDLENGTAPVIGDGESKFTTTTISDIAQTLPIAVLDPENRNKTITSASHASISQNAFLDLIDEVRGTPLTRTQTTLEEIQATVNNEELPFFPRFIALIQQSLVENAANNTDAVNLTNEAYAHIPQLDINTWLQSTINK